jgi:NhaP-type Na+/H+ or K+/H+ antiporter
MVLVLAAFGSEIAGGLLGALTWADGALALLMFAVLRPAACLLAFIGSPLPFRERLAIGLLGLRGLGSFFYMGYALLEGLPQHWGERLWSIVGLVVLASVIVHGATASTVLRRLASGAPPDARHAASPEQEAGSR